MPETHFVYVLLSESTGQHYTGKTNDLSRRLEEHNHRHTRSTRGKGPWSLVYHEQLDSRREASARERFLKSGSGREFLNRVLRSPG